MLLYLILGLILFIPFEGFFADEENLFSLHSFWNHFKKFGKTSKRNLKHLKVIKCKTQQTCITKYVGFYILKLPY